MNDYATLFDPLDAPSSCAPSFASETPAPVQPQVLLHCADALALLQSLPTNSIDALVTDPPYGLSDHRQDLLHECLQAWLAGEAYTPKGRGFMGRQWDAWVPGPEVWREALRVLKPGAHALVFAGTRSMDLMGLALRLAGFELRDSIGYAHTPEGAPLLAWTYGSDFPKSHDFAGTRDAQRARSPHPAFQGHPQAEGWGTALKPAWEPILIARKPLQGTVAENVLRYGTGALNIDGCKVGTDVVSTHSRGSNGAFPKRPGETSAEESGRTQDQRAGLDHSERMGRWPANLIHDGSNAVLAAFPQRITKSTGGKNSKGGIGKRVLGAYALDRTATNTGGLGDEGTPARFFYCAKASRSDRNAGLPSAPSPLLQRGATLREQEDADWATRNGNPHPTVKPTELMRYLCRLVTPPGGTVLDCYMGSGSTGRGAVMEGFHFIGGDNDPANLPIARARIEHAQSIASPPHP